jgi:hypothetical protein
VDCLCRKSGGFFPIAKTARTPHWHEGGAGATRHGQNFSPIYPCHECNEKRLGGCFRRDGGKVEKGIVWGGGEG